MREECSVIIIKCVKIIEKKNREYTKSSHCFADLNLFLFWILFLFFLKLCHSFLFSKTFINDIISIYSSFIAKRVKFPESKTYNLMDDLCFVCLRLDLFGKSQPRSNIIDISISTDWETPRNKCKRIRFLRFRNVLIKCIMRTEKIKCENSSESR